MKKELKSSDIFAGTYKGVDVYVNLTEGYIKAFPDDDTEICIVKTKDARHDADLTKLYIDKHFEKNPVKLSTKNQCGKTRKIDDPYEIWLSTDGTWEWKVLKKYQSPAKEIGNAYARWFCGVKSPYTYGQYELGDVYVKDIIKYARRIK